MSKWVGTLDSMTVYIALQETLVFFYFYSNVHVDGIENLPRVSQEKILPISWTRFKVVLHPTV